MGILVVGSVAIEDVRTPTGGRTRTLGGACTYFATAASLYGPVAMVGIVGTDFPQEHIEFFKSRGIDLRGLQIAEGKTFFWSGRYGDDLDDVETLDTQLNVFAGFHPVLPKDLCNSEYVFLANIDPDLQIEVLEQVQAPRLAALDSMNYWMTSKRESLAHAMSRVDVVLLNESEVRLYTQEPNLIRGARRILEVGPRALVIKRGEHGAMLVSRGKGAQESLFVTPACPVENVVDPTGAGDTFAAGFMGYLARTGDLSFGALRRAVVHGTMVASFTIQDYSIDRLRSLSLAEIEDAYDEFRCLTYFSPMGDVDCQAPEGIGAEL